MVIIAAVFIALLGYWLLPPAIRAVESALSTQKLSKDLRNGKVEIVKLFEQGLPKAAEERFRSLCDQAETHCSLRDIHPHEYLTLFPALPEFIDAYFTIEAEWSSHNGVAAKQTQFPSQPVKYEPLKNQGQETVKSVSFNEEEEFSGKYDLVSRFFPTPSKLTRTVQIVPNATTGALINTYKEDPNYGYLQLRQEITNPDYRNKEKRTAILREETEKLKNYVKLLSKDGKLPGVILIREFLESEVPAKFSPWQDKSKNYWEVVEPYVKYAVGGGPELTVDGERILRFTEWVFNPQPSDVDVIIQHDNQEEVETWERTQRVEKI